MAGKSNLTIGTILVLSVALVNVNSIIVELGRSSPDMCFLIRGKFAESAFELTWAVSGDGIDNVQTIVC